MRAGLLLAAAMFLACGLASAQEEEAVLSIETLDHSGRPAPARVWVLCSDHRFRYPEKVFCGEYAARNAGLRADRGPRRFFGDFFYVPGKAEVAVPKGAALVGARKGYALRNDAGWVDASGRTPVKLALGAPVLDGYSPGDTHVHFLRDGSRDRDWVKLCSAEGDDFAFILSMNGPPKYEPKLDKQLHCQKIIGTQSLLSGDGATIMSSHEYRTRHTGHATILRLRELVPALGATAENDFPPLAEICDQARKLEGLFGHAHGGYGQEIWMDAALGKSDWVELLQMGYYRGFGLDGWYDILNSGYRYAHGGASDFPYCRALGDAITCVRYKKSDEQHPIDSWLTGLIQGTSFTTTGPMLFVSINGQGPGSRIDFEDAIDLEVEALGFTPGDGGFELPLWRAELVVNGKVVECEQLGPAPASVVRASWKARVTQSSWVAVRVEGPEDTRAHTNPVYVIRDGKAPFDPEAALRLRDRINEYYAWLDGKLDLDKQQHGKMFRDIRDAALAEIEQRLKSPPAMPDPPLYRGCRTQEEINRIMRADPRKWPVPAARPGKPETAEVVVRVVDSRGKPVHAAMVTELKGFDEAGTGPDGIARLRAPKNRPVAFQIEAPGYDPALTAYLVAGGETYVAPIFTPPEVWEFKKVLSKKWGGGEERPLIILRDRKDRKVEHRPNCHPDTMQNGWRAFYFHSAAEDGNAMIFAGKASRVFPVRAGRVSVCRDP